MGVLGRLGGKGELEERKGGRKKRGLHQGTFCLQGVGSGGLGGIEDRPQGIGARDCHG